MSIAKAQERRSNHVSIFEATAFASYLPKSHWSKLHSQAQSQRVKSTHTLPLVVRIEKSHGKFGYREREDLGTVIPSTTDKEERRGKERD